MNYKKLIVFSSLWPLLASCAGSSYYGEYAFQMGKTKDTHISVSLELTKERFLNTAGEDKGEKFSLSLDMKTSDVEDGFASILKEITPITGYYNIDKKIKFDGASALKIGINLLGEYDIPEDITDGIFAANITSSEVNIYLPVSMEDLRYQLYWYGWDLSGDNIVAAIQDDTDIEDPIASPDGPHSLDVHPTKEEIDAINEHYKDSHDGELFRDFHVLKLGLTRK